MSRGHSVVKKSRLITAGAVVAVALGAGFATQPMAQADVTADVPPVSAVTLSQGITSAPFKIKANGDRKVLYRKAIVQPGASTGWHYHVGEEIAVINSGTFTRIDGSDCSVEEYASGESLVEPVGPTTVHMGINKGTEPVELYVVDIIPTKATAPTTAAPDPGCDVDALTSKSTSAGAK
ncbi:cupin domain-containing protein [Streptomyces sp. NBC_00572]|uniref:cupin domain-containing protein n=1 Tax=Streptomyces sp. NBC_00572 TaxID=2903664 RepID=UPI00224E589A|nr:cupin domain-containing protein [Streptomyces sp. NBC_00572]MCX4982046.1 cupin domain-containing protein [Streptomyces sp. NBC_00572]